MYAWSERSGLEIEARFVDNIDRPTIPATVHWRLDCATSGTALQDWTTLTPVVTTDVEAGVITDVVASIEVDSALNAIQNRSNVREEKHLLVVAAKDTARQFSQELVYVVNKLQGYD